MELAEHTPHLLQFSADGKWYADVAPGGFGVWESQTGKRRAWLKLPPSMPVESAVFFDGDRGLLLRSDDSLRLWNLGSGKNEGPAPAPLASPLAAALSNTSAIAVAPEGNTLAAGVDRWGPREQRTREIIKEIRLLKIVRSAPGSGITPTTTAPKALAEKVITGRVNPPMWVGFSADGATLYSTWYDTGVRYWDAGTGRLKSTWSTALGSTDVSAVSQDGSLIARGNGYRNSESGAIIVNSSGATVTKLESGRGRIEAIALSPTNTHIAVDYGSSARLYELPTGRMLREFKGLSGMIFSAAFSPDGRILATIGTGGVGLWSVPDGELLGKLVAINFHPHQAVFSPDGRLMASLERDRVLLWDVATQTALCNWASDETRPASVAFTPDGASLAVATNFRVRLYEFKNLPDIKTALRDGPRSMKTALRSWDLTSGPARNIAFSPDGTTMAVACGDGVIQLHIVSDGRVGHGTLRAELRVLPPAGDGQISQNWATITPDGYFTGSPGAAAYLRWREGGRLIADATRFENALFVQQTLAR